MSSKLKILGFGLSVVLVGGFAVMSAPVAAASHFVSSTAHTTIIGSESESHRVRITSGSSEEISCTSSTYEGTTTSTTVTSYTVTPTTTGCNTVGGTAVNMTHNNCVYTLTPFGAFFTKHVTCPQNAKIEYHHTNCTINIPPQTVANAGTYTQTTIGGVHALTLDVSERLKVQYESGICIFLGTNQEMELKGSLILKGFNTEGSAVSITGT